MMKLETVVLKFIYQDINLVVFFPMPLTWWRKVFNCGWHIPDKQTYQLHSLLVREIRSVISVQLQLSLLSSLNSFLEIASWKQTQYYHCLNTLTACNDAWTRSPSCTYAVCLSAVNNRVYHESNCKKAINPTKEPLSVTIPTIRSWRKNETASLKTSNCELVWSQTIYCTFFHSLRNVSNARRAGIAVTSLLLRSSVEFPV